MAPSFGKSHPDDSHPNHLTTGKSVLEPPDLIVTVLEACRSPEVPKRDTECMQLSRYFKETGVEYVVYSNDSIWPDRTVITRDLIRKSLCHPMADIIHIAMHGSREGLVLRWSSVGRWQEREPLDLLRGEEIRNMPEWRGKLIVSGACQSAHIADDFLAAGVRGVVAPASSIPWDDLGAFFVAFYGALGSAMDVASSLRHAKLSHPEYESFIYSEAT